MSRYPSDTEREIRDASMAVSNRIYTQTALLERIEALLLGIAQNISPQAVTAHANKVWCQNMNECFSCMLHKGEFCDTHNKGPRYD